MNAPQIQPTPDNNQPIGTSPSSSEVVIEPFSAHHNIHWYFHRQIAGTPSLGRPQRAMVDDWGAMVKHVFDLWPEEKPILLLADLRREASPTPYQSAKAYELLDYKHQHLAYIAVITSDNLSGQITRLVLRAKNRRNGQIQQFASLQMGLNWLVELGNVTL